MRLDGDFAIGIDRRARADVYDRLVAGFGATLPDYAIPTVDSIPGSSCHPLRGRIFTRREADGSPDLMLLPLQFRRRGKALAEVAPWRVPCRRWLRRTGTSVELISLRSQLMASPEKPNYVVANARGG